MLKRNPTCGGTGAQAIRFRVLRAGDYLGTNFEACNFVDAIVLNVSCGSGPAKIGDEVRIWDPTLCYFGLPIDLLDGLNGTAVLMNNPDLYAVDCPDQNMAEGACRFEVTGICCAEEYGSLTDGP